LPYSASIEPADVLRDMPNGTLQFAIIWATHRMQNAWKVRPCTNHKNVRYK
jgi:hypothetical protein